jgi:hypothetical protein
MGGRRQRLKTDADTAPAVRAPGAGSTSRTLVDVTEPDRASLEALRTAREEAEAVGQALDPLVAGPEHALLAKEVASELRALVKGATDLAELLRSWQYLAGMCGLFDDLEESERPESDWRARIEEALASIEEATA